MTMRFYAEIEAVGKGSGRTTHAGGNIANDVDTMSFEWSSRVGGWGLKLRGLTVNSAMTVSYFTNVYVGMDLLKAAVLKGLAEGRIKLTEDEKRQIASSR